MERSFNDTMHMTLSLVFSLIVVAAVILSAVTYRGMVPAVFDRHACGGDRVWRGDIDRYPRHRAEPYAVGGGFERINAYAYFAWLVVLAVTVIRRSLHQIPPEKVVTEVAQTREPSVAASG